MALLSQNPINQLKYWLSDDAEGADMMIVGLPRSGTSLMCRLLDDYNNMVVINEPREAKKPSPSEDLGEKMARFHMQTRKKIRSGLPIENKVANGGELTEDTWRDNRRIKYLPETANENFVVCTKNTLGYLTQLDAIRAAMPNVRMAMCVRNPIDCIASWKTTFEHLQEPPADKYGPGPAWERRINYWIELANIIKNTDQYDLLIRYEDLTADHEAILDALVKDLPVGDKVKDSFNRVESRSKADQLEPQELAAIEERCLPLYKQL